MSSKITVEIKFFASCRDVTNVNSMKIELDTTEKRATVAVVIDKVLELYPDLQEIMNEISIAINQKYIKDKDMNLKNQDVIAFIPPISGG